MIVSTIDSTVIFCLFVWLCSIFHSATALPAAQTWSSPPQLQMQPTGYPDPRSCQGNCSWIHDPSLVYEDGTYWRFSTSGNIAIATAPRLDGPWSYLGPLLVNGTKIFVGKEQDIWVRITVPYVRCARLTRGHLGAVSFQVRRHMVLPLLCLLHGLAALRDWRCNLEVPCTRHLDRSRLDWPPPKRTVQPDRSSRFSRPRTGSRVFHIRQLLDRHPTVHSARS